MSNRGFQGFQGPPGLRGPRGADGPRGPAGTNGLTGATGPTGPTGPRGHMGIPGIQGVTGPAGTTISPIYEATGGIGAGTVAGTSNFVLFSNPSFISKGAVTPTSGGATVLSSGIYQLQAFGTLQFTNSVGTHTVLVQLQQNGVLFQYVSASLPMAAPSGTTVSVPVAINCLVNVKAGASLTLAISGPSGSSITNATLSLFKISS